MRTSTLLGLAVSFGVVILALKLAAYLVTGSVALLSDALESLVNVVAAALALVASRAASRPADLKHPFGHSKFEYLSAVLEALLIIVAAALIAWQAVARFQAPQPVTGFGLAAVLALVASGLNGGLAAMLMRAGRTKRSPALTAEGVHLWTDVATTFGVLLGLLLARLTGWQLLDPLVALLVALNIVRVGWRLLRDSVGGLVDEGLPEHEIAQIEGAIRSHMIGALEVHDLRTRRAGRSTFVTLHLIVPGAMSVEQAHTISDRLEAAVAGTIPGSKVTIHIEPEGKAKHLGAVVRMGQPSDQ
jgi:cation diffusion facilitator family transporter